jgi:hypothetical protein
MINPEQLQSVSSLAMEGINKNADSNILMEIINAQINNTISFVVKNENEDWIQI